MAFHEGVDAALVGVAAAAVLVVEDLAHAAQASRARRPA
jgi:hypothetical protein